MLDSIDAIECYEDIQQRLKRTKRYPSTPVTEEELMTFVEGLYQDPLNQIPKSMYIEDFSIMY